MVHFAHHIIKQNGYDHSTFHGTHSVSWFHILRVQSCTVTGCEKMVWLGGARLFSGLESFSKKKKALLTLAVSVHINSKRHATVIETTENSEKFHLGG